MHTCLGLLVFIFASCSSPKEKESRVEKDKNTQQWQQDGGDENEDVDYEEADALNAP
ncbi:MAG: hypothetical protein LVR00_01920 [Rhabdochlamydiaceae bacterium]|jgi:outer membrane biogenesis lipoprotein LolB